MRISRFMASVALAGVAVAFTLTAPVKADTVPPFSTAGIGDGWAYLQTNGFWQHTIVTEAEGLEAFSQLVNTNSPDGTAVALGTGSLCGTTLCSGAVVSDVIFAKFGTLQFASDDEN